LPLPPRFSEIEQGPLGGSVWQGPIVNTFVSSARRPTVIYLPPGFSTQTRYPIVFLLQGFRGSPYEYVDGLDLATRADELIASRALAPFIAVIPPAGVTARYDGEWTGVWERYLVDDVVPWAEQHLPGDPSARGRTLAGLSGGGYGAVDIGLRHLGMFGTLESWSGTFDAPHDGSLLHATPDELVAHDPERLVAVHASRVRALGTRFFLSAGSRDVEALGETMTFAGELTSLRVSHRLWLGPGGHTGRFWASQLAAALEYAVPAAAST
jgi:enterochelin esterase-like enzyme